MEPARLALEIGSLEIGSLGPIAFKKEIHGKKRTSTARIMQRMWTSTPGPSECIPTVVPVLDSVRMDESARAAKELEEEVCRREIDEANLAASRERHDRRTAAAADKKMRQRRQQ